MRPLSSGAASLEGVRVLDISRFIAGPYAGQILGHLGAEVVKVEEPGVGDPMRSLSKYGADERMSAHFLAGNASKKSLTLDLRQEAGRDVLLRLLAHADVLIENFRPGVLERLGLSHDFLLAKFPRLIVASVTGFGQQGPWADRAAYDLIAQAVGGGMGLTAWPGGAPVKMGIPIGDVGASLYTAIGVLAALNARAHTGRGDLVDVAMMDVQLSLLNYHAHYYWMSGVEPQPEGDGHPNIVPYQSFPTATGPLVVAVYGDPFWPGFCRAADCEALQHDPRFSTNAQRLANKLALVEVLERQFKRLGRDHWLERLAAEGVPAAPLNSVGEALEEEQTHIRDMAVVVKDDAGAEMRVLGSPMKFSHSTTRISPPPKLSAHTDAVLSEWGVCDAAEIESLRQRNII